VGGVLSAAAVTVSAFDWPEEPSCGAAGELLLSPRLVLDRDNEVGDGSPTSSNGDNTRPPAAPGNNRPPVPRFERPTTSSTTSNDFDEMLLPTGSSATWSVSSSVRECRIRDGDDVDGGENCLELGHDDGNADSTILSSESVARCGV